MTPKIRVLLVEDDFRVSEAMASLLEMNATIQVVGEATTAERCLHLAHALRPDAVLLDLRLPDKPGGEVISALLDDNPNVRIVIMTGCANDKEVAAVVRAGTSGFVLKRQQHMELVQATKKACQELSSVLPEEALTDCHTSKTALPDLRWHW